MVASTSRRVVDLKHAIRQVRIARAEQNDVVAEFGEAEQARLELLGEALEGVLKELPPDHDQLLIGLLPGRPPRFWVDATSFVMMGRDKRLYRFLKDTRLGRTLLAESPSLEVIVDAITRYVAERIVEREQAIEADWLTRAVRSPEGHAAVLPQPAGARAFVWGLGGFGLGLIAGVLLLLFYAWLMAG